jgi:hypothetical protein
MKLYIFLLILREKLNRLPIRRRSILPLSLIVNVNIDHRNPLIDYGTFNVNLPRHLCIMHSFHVNQTCYSKPKYVPQCRLLKTYEHVWDGSMLRFHFQNINFHRP